jgi:hypothetical protein
VKTTLDKIPKAGVSVKLRINIHENPSTPRKHAVSGECEDTLREPALLRLLVEHVAQEHKSAVGKLNPSGELKPKSSHQLYSG